MGLINRLFGRPKKKNALVVLSEENAKLMQLLFLSQQHSAELLAQLKSVQTAYSALSHGSPFRKDSVTVSEPTQKQQEILNLVRERKKVTALQVQEALHYRHRVSASAMLSELIKKGLLKRLNRGKLSAYVLP